MHTNNLFFLFEIFFIFNNLFYQSKSNIPYLSTKEKEQFVSTTDINKPFNDIALLQSFKSSNLTTPNITSRSDNGEVQNISDANVILRRSKKTAEKVSKGVYKARQRTRRRKRQTILYHPTQKMDADEKITFRTKVSPDCKLGHKTFTVMKKSIRHGATKSALDRFKFYAIARRFDSFIELEGNPLSDRIYKHQIGAITCGPGWIFNLDVYNNAELKVKNEQGQYIDRIVNARKCGVGVVLTELCLLDSDIYALDEHNRGKTCLDDDEITLYQNCHKFVGLTMAAHSPGDGHVYLSSAIRTGYQGLLVYRGGLMDGEVDYNTYNTRDARQNFDSSTGEIEPCCGNDRCEAWLRNWYFCDVTP